MNSLAQYLQMFQAAPRIGGGSGFMTFGSPAHAADQERLQQYNNANMQRNADLEFDDRRSQIDARNRASQFDVEDGRSRIDFRNRIGQAYGQPMPNFYGDGPQMPQQAQQSPYQFSNALARMVR